MHSYISQSQMLFDKLAMAITLSSIESKLLEALSELKEYRKQSEAVKDENAQLRADLRKCKDVLVELGIGVKKLSSDGQGKEKKVKKPGISAETTRDIDRYNIKIVKFPKDEQELNLIERGISNNNLLGHLDKKQINAIGNYMVLQNFTQGQAICKEGENGDFLYVISNGCVEVTKGGEHYGLMEKPQSFGELAILYNCPRTATITANTPVSLWALERRAYKKIMHETDKDMLNERTEFLTQAPVFKNLNKNEITKLASVLEEEFVPENEVIVRQGAVGETFYIIRDGHVKVTELDQDGKKEIALTTLTQGQYFGEVALQQPDSVRTATVTAITTVHLFSLEKEYFEKLIGDLPEEKKVIFKRGYSVDHLQSSRILSKESDPLSLTISNINKLGIMGQGAYGTVYMCTIVGIPAVEKNQIFALKQLKKQRVVDAHQQEHVLNEKLVMQQCSSHFICKLYLTFKDSKCAYMLIEPCIGGEVWTTMRDREKFSPDTARFITACCIEAVEYLHRKEIIYRDLKPENLLFDREGYVKLTDFGFAKKIGYGSLTWTFCGTNEYMAPEIILNQGHSFPVDIWCLGILIFELLTGRPPFESADPRRLYNLILTGIDAINFPWTIQSAGRNIIKALARMKPIDRLGYQKEGLEAIRRHRWFQSFDWPQLRARTLSPPLKPTTTSDRDLRNFDPNITDNLIDLNQIPDETSGWDATF